MNILPIGTDDVISETALTISSLSLQTVNSITYTNTTTTYSIISTYISDVYFQTNSESISVVENNNISISPLLPCSFSGATSISYSIDKYNGETIPSWLTIDSNTGILKIIAPEVSTDTIIHFYINSLVSGYSSLFQKIVILNLLNCVVQNCLQCSSNSSSTCSTCISGYYLNSGICVLNKSTVSSNQPLSIATQSIIGAVFIMIMLSNIINSSSISSLWSLLNQVQLFFLLLLTRAYIPSDIKSEITGPDFALNPFKYIQLDKLAFNSPIQMNFYFSLSNSALEDLTIKSESTIYNILSFLEFAFIIILIHLVVYILFKATLKCKEEGKCSKCIKVIKWIAKKSVNILTFGYYIRSILEINQYLLISVVYEIYKWNTSESLRILSLSLSIVLFLLCFCLICFTIGLSLSSYQLDEDKHNKLEEFYSGIKQSKRFQLYLPALLIRRIIFVVILITTESFLPRIIISTLSIIQIGYLTIIVILRPFNFTKNNIIEITNECYYLFLLFFLIFFNADTNWNSSIISLYSWILISNSIFIFIIVTGDLIRWSILKTRDVCRKTYNTESSLIRIIPTNSVMRTTVLQENASDNQMRRGSIKNHKINDKREENKYSLQDNLSQIYALNLNNFE